MITFIDFRSDTVTKPTDEMREAIFHSEVGDDIYGEDPTMKRLENMAADLLGKEKALFVTSGTQGNLLAVLSQTSRGDEVILPDDSHMILSETGTLAAIAGVQTRTLKTSKGEFDNEEMIRTLRTKNDLHKPETGLIGIENTHTDSGGSILPLEYLKDLHEISKEKNIPLHMDGARIFNASIGLGVDVKEIAQHADTVQFCLSKGLGAPMGSILTGSEEVINRALRWRKILGGATRQAGIVGAAGIVARESMTERLKIDHENATILAEGLKKKNLNVLNEEVESNIVLLSIRDSKLEMNQFLNLLKNQGLLVNALDSERIRFVLHHEISHQDVLEAIELICSIED